MKWIYHILFIAVIISHTSYGQSIHIHTHIDNHDHETRRKLLFLNAEIVAINEGLSEVKDLLKDAKENHRKQLDLQYKKNKKYDKSSKFIKDALTSTALSFGPDMLSNSVTLPYMTKEKEAYLRDVAMNKLILSALQNVDANKIKLSRRQEIYRLRSKLLREYSKLDREARGLLYLPVGGLMISNYKEFEKMSKVLKALEIAL